MSRKLNQIQLERFVHSFEMDYSHTNMVSRKYNEASMNWINRIFGKIGELKPSVDELGDKTRSLWIRVARGTIEDFGSFEDCAWQYDVESREEYVKLWRDLHPHPVQWYRFDTVETKHGYRGLIVNNDLTYQDGDVLEECKSCYEFDHAEVLEKIYRAIEEAVEKIRTSDYRSYVEKNLPHTYRTGKILRKDYWDIFPGQRKYFFKGVRPEEVSEFITITESEKLSEKPLNLLQNLTSTDYYETCSICYKAALMDTKGMTPKEQYRRYAYMSDQGLSKLNPESSEDFLHWVNGDRECGHYYRIVSGGSFHAINLHICNDGDGYYYSLSGPADCSLIDTMRMFLALRKSGIPVALHHSESMVNRLKETDYIGFVPKYNWPYAYRWHIYEGIYLHLHLPLHNRKKLIEKTIWNSIIAMELEEQQPNP